MSKARKTSRRDFLKGAATGAAGMMLAGSLGACTPKTVTEENANLSAEPPEAAPAATTHTTGELPWLGPEPKIDDANVESNITADVIVIGAGVSGVAAVRSAVEAGGTVAVFEKAEGPQSRSGQYAVLGGIQKTWNRDDVDPEEVINFFMMENSYHNKRAIFSKYLYGSAEAFDWWIAATPDLYIAPSGDAPIPEANKNAALVPLQHPKNPNYNYKEEIYPCFPVTVSFSPSHQFVLEANMAKASSEGEVSTFYGHFAEKLIMENGRVTGVYARNAKTGKYVKATASKGVILATGEYMNNKEIMNYYCPEVVENNIPLLWPNMDVEGKPTNTGDGLKLGSWVGAKIQQYHAPMIHHMGAGGGKMGVMGIACFLQLDADGKRFMNEDIPGQQIENQIEMLKGMYSYQIFDSKWKEELAWMPQAHGQPQSTTSQADVDKAVEAGDCVKADTIEALLDQLDIDKTAALASIVRYNELAHKGKDDDFGKPAKRLFPLETGPFYAIKFTPAPMLVCIGGLESDENCHTFDKDRNVIPGLYVAGNIMGNRYSVQYPISCPGISHALCMFYGKVAGANAVAGI